MFSYSADIIWSLHIKGKNYKPDNFVFIGKLYFVWSHIYLLHISFYKN